MSLVPRCLNTLIKHCRISDLQITASVSILGPSLLVVVKSLGLFVGPILSLLEEHMGLTGY